MRFFPTIFLLAALILPNFYVHDASACACGCGVLNVGTSSLIPNSEGGTAFLQYDYMSQSRNWHDSSKSDLDNHDKRIETQTVTAGAQYMFNRDWGAAIRVPYITRSAANWPDSDETPYERHDDIGDISVMGIYSGFSDNMSSGITFGLKLPTGATKDANFERNTQIGTGTVDSILGAYHVGKFSPQSKAGYFAQTSWDQPLDGHSGYKPGYEVSGAIGTYYNAGSVGIAKRITPIVQFTGAHKSKDSGWADPDHNPNSGYNMVFFAPGVEITLKQFKIYADVELPVYRNVNGVQLVPQNLYKVILGYNF